MIIIKTALTIAGSDCSGGAGIQADIKTMTMHGVYAMSAITALTAQNTLGVWGIQESSPEFLKKQLDCIFTDIRPDAVKIGMVSSANLIHVIADTLIKYNAENVVIDPVMVSTSGSGLISDEAVETLKSELFLCADIITPNAMEAEVLCGFAVNDKEDMERAAAKLGQKYGCAVLCKGGHTKNPASDVMYSDGRLTWFCQKTVDSNNTHGTGCTLSSAIAANLAKGMNLEKAVDNAKKYLTEALCYGLDIGHGNGPLNHAYAISKKQ